MGKSGSKLSAESLERLRQPSSKRGELANLPKDFQVILDDQQLLAAFLTDIFYQEVQVSECLQTLFRGNCLASKIMSHCFRTFGQQYLKQLLAPHIEPLLSENNNNNTLTSSAAADYSSEHQSQATQTTTTNHQQPPQDSPNRKEAAAGISYEIDSARLEKDGNIDVNQRNLLKLTKQILDSILASGADFPAQLNSMCICLRQVLCQKYPDSNTNLKAVGTVIFLRFINPAIVSPFEVGVVERQPPARTLRGLMLVSKILQNIANNVEFSKEEHMLPFNDFVRTQIEPLRKWVSEISTERPPSQQQQQQPTQLPQQETTTTTNNNNNTASS